MQYMINGAKYAFSTLAAALVPISAITNGNPAVATAAQLPDEGAIVLLESNWSDLNDQAALVTASGSGTFTLGQVDTSDLTKYPAGESTGSYQVLSGFTNFNQIRSIDQSGGDANNFAWSYVDDSGNRGRSRPTDDNPIVLTFMLDYDPAAAWYTAADTVSRKRQMVAMRETLPTGDVLIYTGYMSFNKSPTRTRNENMTVSAVMTINSEVLRYPAVSSGS